MSFSIRNSPSTSSSPGTSGPQDTQGATGLSGPATTASQAVKDVAGTTGGVGQSGSGVLPGQQDGENAPFSGGSYTTATNTSLTSSLTNVPTPGGAGLGLSDSKDVGASLTPSANSTSAYRNASPLLQSILKSQGDPKKIDPNDWKQLVEAFPSFSSAEQSAVKQALNNSFPANKAQSNLAGGDSLQAAVDGQKTDPNAAINRLKDLQQASHKDSNTSNLPQEVKTSLDSILKAAPDPSKIDAGQWTTLAKSFGALPADQQKSVKSLLSASFPATVDKSGFTGGDALQYASDGNLQGNSKAIADRLAQLQQKP